MRRKFKASLRFANQKNTVCFKDYFEIVSLVGTLTAKEGMHLHLGIANRKGKMLGGHLKEGNIIYTTVEIAIAELPFFLFQRAVDPTYGYKELIIEKRKEEEGSEDPI